LSTIVLCPGNVNTRMIRPLGINICGLPLMYDCIYVCMRCADDVALAGCQGMQLPSPLLIL